eukprot:108675-Rhodomonas_salina.2
MSVLLLSALESCCFESGLSCAVACCDAPDAHVARAVRRLQHAAGVGFRAAPGIALASHTPRRSGKAPVASVG